MGNTGNLGDTDDIKEPQDQEQPEEKDEQSEPDKDSASDAGTGNESADDVTDKHGQPGINKERHEREVKALNAKIAELEAQVAAAAESKQGREALEKSISDLKAEMADKDLTHSLERAGCKNTKAAKALLDDYEGDVDKLKSECPYLFDTQKKTGSSGLPPKGPSKDLEEKLDKAFGLNKKG
jgi:hypothetical protein